MTTRRFFSPHPIDSQRRTIAVTDDEFFHLKNVNRAKTGDTIEVINGQGTLIYGEILSLKNNEAKVEIKHLENHPQPPHFIIVAPSLLKQRPMNLLIEKLAEIGVDQIRPVIFARTDETYRHQRLEKWQRLIPQSLKVNKRLWATQIFPPVSLEEFLKESKTYACGTRILLDIYGKPWNSQQLQPPMTAVIGPPGDLEERERILLVENGFVPYKINESVLKSETAAISISAVLSLNRPILAPSTQVSP